MAKSIRFVCHVPAKHLSSEEFRGMRFRKMESTSSRSESKLDVMCCFETIASDQISRIFIYTLVRISVNTILFLLKATSRNEKEEETSHKLSKSKERRNPFAFTLFIHLKRAINRDPTDRHKVLKERSSISTLAVAATAVAVLIAVLAVQVVVFVVVAVMMMNCRVLHSGLSTTW